MTMTSNPPAVVDSDEFIVRRTFPVQVEEFDAPKAIAYRWGGPDDDPSMPLDPGSSTVFRFTLEAVDGGTQLTVVESGFNFGVDPAKNMDDHRGGWDWELDELVAYLEGS